jgi:dynein heavy chain 2, cytosolic
MMMMTGPSAVLCQGAAYEAKLTALDSYLTMMNSIQRKWVYLEPIFARGALPGEQAR